MTITLRALVAVSILAAVGSTGCLGSGAVTSLAPAIGTSLAGIRFTGGARPRPPVDRAMTACELERGRWREANQDQDEPPRELQCLQDGSYPDHPQAAAREALARGGKVP